MSDFTLFAHILPLASIAVFCHNGLRLLCQQVFVGDTCTYGQYRYRFEYGGSADIAQVV